MRSTLLTTLLLGLLASHTSAFTILTDVNTLSQKDLTVNGVYTPSLVTSLKTSGLYALGGVNTDLSSDQLREIYKLLGTKYVVCEDGDFTVINYVGVNKLAGHVDDEVSYYEQGWDKTIHIPAEKTTTLSPTRVTWVLGQLHQAGFDKVKTITVLTRAYSDQWRPSVDAALADPVVGGILVEMNPNASSVRAFHIPELAKKTLAAGKKFYMLLPPILGLDPNYNYSKQIGDQVSALREGEALKSDDIYLIPAIYGGKNTTWFGPKNSNSIQAGIEILKAQREAKKDDETAPFDPDAPIKL